MFEKLGCKAKSAGNPRGIASIFNAADAVFVGAVQRAQRPREEIVHTPSGLNDLGVFFSAIAVFWRLGMADEHLGRHDANLIEDAHGDG